MIGDSTGLSGKKNKTTEYLLPLITKETRAVYENDNGDKLIINCFLKSVEKPDLDNHVFMVLNPMVFQPINLSKRLESQPNYKFKYKAIYNNIVTEILVFEIPEEWAFDVEKLVEGKYTEIDHRARFRITTFWKSWETPNGFPTQAKKALCEEAGNCELYKKPFNMEEETLPEEEVLDLDFDA